MVRRLLLTLGCALGFLVGCGGGGGSVRAVAPHTSWVQTATGTGTVTTCKATALLPDSSIAVAGAFDDQITLAPGTASQTVLDGSGSHDAFLARYTSAGELLWARAILSAGDVSIEGVAVASDGTISVSGWFGPDATFAPAELAETYVVARGAFDGFLASYDSSGEFQWARQIGGDAQALRVAWLTGGDVAVAGLAAGFDVEVSYGQSDSITIPLLAESGFVAAFRSDGSLDWARVTNSTTSSAVWGVGAVPGNGIAILGQFEGSCSLGTATDGSDVVVNSAGGVDSYVAVFDSAGRVQWARTVGGPANDFPYCMATDGAGLVYAAGTYASQVTAEPGTGASQSLDATGSDEALWVLSYDGTGALRWLRGTHGSSDQVVPMCLATFPDGGLAVVGAFTGSATLAAGEAGERTVVAAGADGFAARLAPDGQLDWVAQVADTLDGEAICGATLADGTLIVGGYFGGSSRWGLPSSPSSVSFLSGIPSQLFLARYEANGGF